MIQSSIAAIRSWNHRRIAERRTRRRAERQGLPVLCVMACVKDEGRSIREWVDHYFWQGAAHLLVIDNGSSDETVGILQAHPRRADITLFEWPEPHQQLRHYRRALVQARIRERFQWLIVADGDEFWFAKSGAPLADVLAGLERIDLVYCNWTLFGTASDGAHPASLRKDLIRCRPRPGEHDFTKWAVRTEALADPSMLAIHKVAGIRSTHTVSDMHQFQINHYYTQSRSYWGEVKMRRGSAVSPENAAKRTWAVFEGFEAGCTETDELLAMRVRAAEAASGG